LESTQMRIHSYILFHLTEFIDTLSFAQVVTIVEYINHNHYNCWSKVNMPYLFKDVDPNKGMQESKYFYFC
jgi:hypothetical protein